jgi:hypothetical protein
MKRHARPAAAVARPPMKPIQMPLAPSGVANPSHAAKGAPTPQYAPTVMIMGSRVSFTPRSAPLAVACTQSAIWKSAANMRKRTASPATFGSSV